MVLYIKSKLICFALSILQFTELPNDRGEPQSQPHCFPDEIDALIAELADAERESAILDGG